MTETLPELWQQAREREQAGAVTVGADPGPERRIARLLGAFVAVGLFFLVLPGTLIGVWNLIRISSSRAPDAAAAVWIQAHGHGQLFGWVGTFILGISLYAVPKFRGGYVRSLRLGWWMWILWTAGTATRWAATLWQWHWERLLVPAAAAQAAVALLLVWQTSASGKSRARTELWNIVVFAGFFGFAATMLWQLVALWRLPAAGAPVLPPDANHWFLTAALWLFCFPVAWGFSLRFLPVFLGLPLAARRTPAFLALAALVISLWPAARALVVAAVVLAALSLRIFEPARRPAKTFGVDPGYPLFARLAFGWLTLAAILQAAGATPGLAGAGRHAFTAGFLATLIFTVGPRILPSFANSRELWSPRLMRWASVVLTAGCTLRVVSEPLAYAEALPLAWKLLPASAILELTAVLLFAFNLARSLATPMPAWFHREQVKDTMPLYWYVTSYPATRRLLIDAGVKTLQRNLPIPPSLTLREAAQAEGLDSQVLVEKLGAFFQARLARALVSR